MQWSQVLQGFDAKVLNECRAGILVGSRLPISDDPAAALAVQRWAAAQKGVELWIVDDLLGLASEQPIFAGICIHQAFGLDGDHQTGLTVAEYGERVSAATVRMKKLLPGLEEPSGPIGPFFVWSGPLCGGFLVKGVFREEYRDEDLWFDTEAPCAIYTASRGARQDPASGGVFGVELFSATYDASNEPPLLTPDVLTAGDAKLSKAGILADARLFVLPHYD